MEPSFLIFSEIRAYQRSRLMHPKGVSTKMAVKDNFEKNWKVSLPSRRWSAESTTNMTALVRR